MGFIGKSIMREGGFLLLLSRSRQWLAANVETRSLASIQASVPPFPVVFLFRARGFGPHAVLSVSLHGDNVAVLCASCVSPTALTASAPASLGQWHKCVRSDAHGATSSYILGSIENKANRISVALFPVTVRCASSATYRMIACLLGRCGWQQGQQGPGHESTNFILNPSRIQSTTAWHQGLCHGVIRGQR